MSSITSTVTMVIGAKPCFVLVLSNVFGKGVFYTVFTDSITGKVSDNLVLLSGLCVGGISYGVFLGYTFGTFDDCDG
jgi:hypothetical protein